MANTRWMTLPNGRKVKEQRFEDCEVFWVTYTGDRLHRKAHHHTAKGCRIVIRNTTATITMPDGTTMKKLLGRSGFSFAVKGPSCLPSTPRHGQSLEAQHQ